MTQASGGGGGGGLRNHLYVNLIIYFLKSRVLK